MNRFVIFYVTLFMGSQCTARFIDYEYGYTYVREADAWLRLHTEAVWAEAGMRCFLEGGVLASPTTSAMADVMSAMMADQMMHSVFTGINSIMSSGDFKTLDGTPLSSISTPWASGEPDNGNSDANCLSMNGGGSLEVVSCQAELPYFCRKETVNKCGPKGNGYEWEPSTGSCYKFHRAAETWLSALATCHSEGAHLAIVNSYTESTVLKGIFDKNPAGYITDATEPNYASIGFRKWDDGEWATIYGDSLEAAGFTGWSKGEPNNDSRWPENCGSIFRDGRLNDGPCHLPYAFICEITP